eukprot:213793-Pyramimonas_sp.AAC.2
MKSKAHDDVMMMSGKLRKLRQRQQIQGDKLMRRDIKYEPDDQWRGGNLQRVAYEHRPWARST